MSLQSRTIAHRTKTKSEQSSYQYRAKHTNGEWEDNANQEDFDQSDNEKKSSSYLQEY